jgi:hypothetical protein
MILEIARTFSFFLSILSLYPVVGCAFFIPGTRWDDRMVLALAHIGLAGCICLLSGILFARPWLPDHSAEHLLATLPLRMFLWTVLAVTVLFILSWYLDVSLVPWLWRNQP